MSNDIDKLRAKMDVQHPLYPWLRVDMRTQAEVEQSRMLRLKKPIHRLARSARRQGRSFTVAKDVDGAYRVTRLDGTSGLIKIK